MKNTDMHKPVKVERKDIYFKPDKKRVLARFFSLGEERTIKVIKRALELTESERKEVFGQVLRSYTKDIVVLSIFSNVILSV
ncbi:hypothetical protein [Sphingobacterium sp. E70]|uniref:hypothetical protein n=1 Tax=Sphingobacterium sp. E70 TaxID=2853439 RepID=UPI00211CC4BB|nr:hypothetical protein [Sphingobacterium sp. E70]